MAKDENGANVMDQKSRTALETLHSEKLPSLLKSENMFELKVLWHNHGIDVETHSDHQTYLTAFTKQISTKLKEMITSAKAKEVSIVEERNRELFRRLTAAQSKADEIHNPSEQKSTEKEFKNMIFLARTDMAQIVTQHKQIEDSHISKGVYYSTLNIDKYNELVHHMMLCKRNADEFVGREKEIADIHNMLLANKNGSIMLIHGEPGCGKTMLMSKVVSLLPTWMNKKCVALYRCINTTGASSSLLSTLRNICLQLTLSYNEIFVLSNQYSKQKVINDFHTLLRVISVKYGKAKPLVLVVDGIDTISASSWVPKKCPKWVYLFITCSNKSNLKLDNDDYLVQSLKLPSVNELKQFVSKHSRNGKHCLSESQIAFIQKSINATTNALLVDMWISEAHTWKSYEKHEQKILPSSLAAAVGTIFTQLEQQHGAEFISNAILYISLCHHGITEQELEDALSCNAAVLNEVYEYHDPPSKEVIRIPPLMWARVRYGIQCHIRYSYMYSRVMMQWKHEEFKNVAIEKYCTQSKVTKQVQIHYQLAEIFLTEDSILKTISLEKRNITLDNANRLVTPYPLESLPKRAMLAMVYHSAHTKDKTFIMRHILANYKFLHYFTKTCSSHRYISSLLQISEQIANDAEIDLIIESIQSTRNMNMQSEYALSENLLSDCLPYKSMFVNIKGFCDSLYQHLAHIDPYHLKPLSGFGKPKSSQMAHILQEIHYVYIMPHYANLVFLQSRKSGMVGMMVDLNKNEIVCRLTRHQGYTNKSIKMCSFTENFLFIMCANKIGYYNYSNNPSNLAQQTIDIKRVGLLNDCMATSRDSKSIVLASSNKLALLKQIVNDGATRYEVAHVMTLSGSTETTNIIYTDDELSTVSTHTLSTEKKTPIGVIVLWEFTSPKLKSKVVLPAAVNREALLQVDVNIYVCACIQSKTLMVDMDNAVVLKQIDNGSLQSIKTSQLLSLHLSKSRKKITCWNIGANKEASSYTLNDDLLGACVVFDDVSCDDIIVGTTGGDVLLTSLDNSNQRILKGHSDKVTTIVSSAENILSFSADERVAILWNIRRNTSKDIKIENQVNAINEINVTNYCVFGSRIVLSHKTVTLSNAITVYDLKTSSVDDFASLGASVNYITGFENKDQLHLNVVTDKEVQVFSNSESKTIPLDVSNIHDIGPSIVLDDSVHVSLITDGGKEFKQYVCESSMQVKSVELAHSMKFDEVVKSMQYLNNNSRHILFIFENGNKCIVQLNKEGHKQHVVTTDTKCIMGFGSDQVVYSKDAVVHIYNLLKSSDETLDTSTCEKKTVTCLVVSSIYVPKSQDFILLGTNKGHLLKWDQTANKLLTTIGNIKSKVIIL